MWVPSLITIVNGTYDVAFNIRSTHYVGCPMNYFAHGMRFVDRPYFLAGTAVPDWLSVADRKVRMRTRRVDPFADDSGSIQAEVAAGVLQHLADDQWFHATRAFVETTNEVAALFRSVLGTDDGYRPGFLGHITTELLLDAILIESNPGVIDQYYDVIQSLDADAVQQSVNRMAKADDTNRLAPLIGRFYDEQFLRDYSAPPRLLFRLNQVMRRIKLRPLPDEIEEVLRAGCTIVRDRAGHLLQQWNSAEPT